MRSGGINEHVIARLDGALILRPAGQVGPVAAERAADGWRGICRIVNKLIRGFRVPRRSLRKTAIATE